MASSAWKPSEGRVSGPFLLDVKHSVLMFICLAVVLALTAIMYLPALEGGFLFDDFVNLKALAEHGQLTSYDAIVSYITSGLAGPTGRPLALATFLLNDNAWPSLPYSFKRTNLLFHLLTVCAMALMVFRVALFMGRSDRQAVGIAVFAASIWSLHPYNVSTVMYVVQRMTILAAFFGCLGVWFYLMAREKWVQSQRVFSILFLLFSGIAFLLGVLSKENLVMAPLLILILEVYYGRSTRSAFSVFFLTICSISAVAILGYLSWILIQNSDNPWYNREYTSVERLLTQSRIIFYYLYDIVVPKSATSGIFHDHILHSKNLIEPLSTFVCSVALIGFVVAAVIWRHKFRLVACMGLLFLASHSIESTTANLELYFEHRNYFPMMFLALAGAVAVFSLIKYRYVAIVVTCSLLAGLLMLRAQLWSDPASMQALWERKNPDSIRIRVVQAQNKLAQGDYYGAIERVDYLIQRYPNHPHAYVLKMAIDCLSSQQQDQKNKQFYDAAVNAVKTYNWTSSTPKLLTLLVTLKNSTECGAMDRERILQILNAQLDNPNTLGTSVARVLDLKGETLLSNANITAAIESYQAAFDVFPDDDLLIKIVVTLASHGHIVNALTFLEKNENSSIISHPDYNHLKAKLNKESRLQ